MNLEDFKKNLHAIFESCDYSAMLKEDEEKVKFSFNGADGKVYEVEVEPSENEFYVYQDGKQIDLFNTNLLDKDGGITKDVRQAIVKDWEDNHKNASSDQPAAPAEEVPVEAPVQEAAVAAPSPTPAPTVPTEPAVAAPAAAVPTEMTPAELEEAVKAQTLVGQDEVINEVAEIIKKFQDQYGAEKGKQVYYATANAQGRDPETFKKK